MENHFNYDRIAKAIEFITKNVQNQPELDEVAAAVHLSPFHFQKMFTEWVGISPKRFLQYLTTDFLKSKLHETANLAQAADLAGLSSPSRVYDLFTTLEAMTPAEFRNGGTALTIFYGVHPTPFGDCLLAATERGVCKLEFVDETTKQLEINDLQTKWMNARLMENQELTATYVAQIFRTPQYKDLEKPKIHLLVSGTNFQVKVWEALLNIPFGGLTTYQKIAEAIGSPKAVRAVGTAVGNNPIAYLIPCHRVIRKEGILGQYHWGEVRKKAIVGYEMSKATEG
jgi:AraC family transcriptional regulator, regulatory protein of adaptative response / methylated-DNA-[protein]-cysteine methyltransferase